MSASQLQQQNEQKIKKLILSGELLKAQQLSHFIDYNTLNDLLFSIAYDHNSICSYTFVTILLFAKETKQHHDFAIDILINGLFYLRGAYESAMYHVIANNFKVKKEKIC